MIRSNLPVCCQTMYFKEAVEAGAIALFDEKYGDQVRVLKIGDPPVSIELCGGTHVSATGEIGLFIITAESSIGAGLRRIEAITGRTAEETINKHSQLIASTSSMLEVSSIDEIPQRIGHILDNNARLVKLIEDQQRQAVFQQARELISRAEKIGSVQLVSAFLPDIKIDLLRDTADYVKEKLSSGIVALASVNDEKPVFVVAVTGDLVKHGYKAGDIVREMSCITGGGGGGKPELAPGGVRNASKLEEALASLKKMVAKDS
jgi:alanyl-tRNA synthetase